MAGDRKCKATTNKGAPCKSAPQHGKDFCLAHDQEARESGRFGGAQPGAGRPSVPRATDLQRELVERHACAILRPHFKALGLMLNDDGTIDELDHGAIVTGESRDGDVIASTIEDLGAQIAAAEKLLDRVFGRPKQTQELVGAGGGPVELVEIPKDTDWDSAVKEALADMAPPPVPVVNGNGNGHANGNGHH